MCTSPDRCGLSSGSTSCLGLRRNGISPGVEGPRDILKWETSLVGGALRTTGPFKCPQWNNTCQARVWKRSYGGVNIKKVSFGDVFKPALFKAWFTNWNMENLSKRYSKLIFNINSNHKYWNTFFVRRINLGHTLNFICKRVLWKDED